ncbi:MFS transporter [Beijerinckia sp. L45]|uniref:MFS transporter n=1 Tax=Beijerinckia sp. L45 TaxID=1641855 RepID=UPI00131C5421|nr:MFS transporter [Beijerinckia sp. L45]
MVMLQDRAGSGAAETPLALLKPHWRLVLAAFLGWFLDAFDQVTLLLVLPEIGKHFGVSLTAMGLVITAQSLGRIGGNIGWGWLADKYGRKLTFMLGVIWFAAFSGLSGLAWSYGALLVIQLLFGIGFGGEWTASAALLMETVPERARAMASSLMMAGYEVGFFAAAGVQALLLPHFGWRVLFFVGVAPALLAVFIRVGINESPVWLRMQRERASGTPAQQAADKPTFSMTPAAWQACAFMLALQFQTASIYDFYPTLLKTVGGFGPSGVFAGIAAYSIGSVLGKLICGQVASRIGARPTILGCLAITFCAIIPFASAFNAWTLLASAMIIGASSSGVFALVPHYLSLRFSNAIRSFGMGIAYALAAGGQAVATYVLPKTGESLGLSHAIMLFVGVSTVVTAAVAFWTPRVLPGQDMEAAA